MSWFAAHLILKEQASSSDKESIIAIERIVLKQGRDPDRVYAELEAMFAGNERESLIGIKKLMLVENSEDEEAVLGDGVELTFSQYEATSAESLSDFVAGLSTLIWYVD